MDFYKIIQRVMCNTSLKLSYKNKYTPIDLIRVVLSFRGFTLFIKESRNPLRQYQISKLRLCQPKMIDYICMTYLYDFTLYGHTYSPLHTRLFQTLSTCMDKPHLIVRLIQYWYSTGNHTWRNILIICNGINTMHIRRH